jgi:hypothetical protein
MPDGAEVDPVVRPLMIGSASAPSGRPLTSGYAPTPEALGQRQQLRRRELLIAQEDHDVLEQAGAYRPGGRAVAPSSRSALDAEHLGAERVGEHSDCRGDLVIGDTCGLLEAAVYLRRELAATLGRTRARVTRAAARASGTQTLADGRAVALIRDGAGGSHCSRNAAGGRPMSVQRGCRHENHVECR